MADTPDFEFCKICNRHHQDGNRHKYFPKHLNSLTSFLSRFQSKLSDVRFFLKNPTLLLPQHASRNRLWCVFCDRDVTEIGSSFACSNAICHLASASHLKSLKTFFWKNGASMDQVDSFVILEPDLAKWKNRCSLLQKESLNAGEASNGSAVTYGPSNEMRIIRFGRHRWIRVSGLILSIVRMAFHLQFNLYNSPIQAYLAHCSMQIVSSVISSIPLVSGEGAGNVHTGAPPPWLDPVSNQDTPLKGSHADKVKSPSQKSNKSRKLNPKRVGAAWAEKRKFELEMEKRGEMSAEKADDCWLPNFGGVWQTGSRKMSKKDFELEKKKASDVFTQTEMPVEILPYVSKKRRTDGGGTSTS